MEYKYEVVYHLVDETQLTSTFTSDYEIDAAHYLYNLETNGDFYFLGEKTVVNKAAVKWIKFERVGRE